MDDDTASGFTIVSWNINGIRSLSMKQVLEERLGFHSNILCVQETKSTRARLQESQALVEKYTSYFSFCKNRSGYSGVATYCSTDFTPTKAEDGLFGTQLDEKGSLNGVGSYCDLTEEEEYEDAKFADNDGRAVITQHVVCEPDGTERLLNVINVYCPRLRDEASDPVNNTQYKLTFHNMLLRRAKSMVQKGQFALVLGDFNVSHKLFDQSCIDNPKLFIQNEFRDWLEEFISTNNGPGFSDTFRSLHPERIGAFTCWDTKTNARQNNFGSRIDYIMADVNLMKYLQDADVHQSVGGSDHCPISATFHSLHLKPSKTIHCFATKFYPEYTGRQQNILDLFKKQQRNSTSNSVAVENKNDKVQGRKRTVSKQTSLTAFILKKPKLDSSDDVEKVKKEVERELQSSTVPNIGQFYKEVNSKATEAWKTLMKVPDLPYCTGHNELAIVRTVRKQGANQGRRFYACPRGKGTKDDKNANCGFLVWAKSLS